MIKINQKKYHRTGKKLSSYDMAAYLPKLKKQYPWLSEVTAQSLQIVCYNLADSYNRFFKKKAAYPRLKKRAGKNSFTVVNGADVLERHIKLPKLGLVRYRGGDKPEGKIKRITINKSTDKYYASILIETPNKKPDLLEFETITGIDLGLIDLIVTSYGEKFRAPKHFRKAKDKLRTANKKLARAQRSSNRRKKANIVLGRIHEKLRNQRKDTNHKITRILVNDSENQAFGIENLSVKNMMANRKLSLSIADAGWHQFMMFLKYKSCAVGKQVIEVDRFFPSSKTCSVCGIVNDNLALYQRLWTCDECGECHDRDINAACNIAFEAARNAAHGGDVSPRLALADAGEVRIRT